MLTTPHADLERLLGYLEVDLATFTPSEARYFGRLSELLADGGAMPAGTSVDRTSFGGVVRRYQAGLPGLEVDGIPGEDTCWALQGRWARSRNLGLVRVEADQVPGFAGFDAFILRSDAGSAYEAMRREVRALGGVVTSAGGLRPLGANVTRSRSRTSIHYCGLALDLSTVTGMLEVDRAPYLVVRDGTRWRVWCRSPTASEVHLDAVLWREGSAPFTSPVTARAFDFTAIAEKHGFARIGPRANFPEQYLGAEWWHFQYVAALTPWISQFGIELLGIGRTGGGLGIAPYDERRLSARRSMWPLRKLLFQRRGRGNGWW